MKKGTFTDHHNKIMQKGNRTEMKMIRYMPPQNMEQVHRMEAHDDVTLVTFQLYGDLEGLEVSLNSKRKTSIQTNFNLGKR